MIIVVGSSYSPDSNYAVISALILLKSKLMPESVIGIYKNVGGIIRSFLSKSGSDFCCKSKRFCIVYCGKQYRSIVAYRPIRIPKKVTFFRTTKFENAVTFHSHTSIRTIKSTGKRYSIKADITL